MPGDHSQSSQLKGDLQLWQREVTAGVLHVQVYDERVRQVKAPHDRLDRDIAQKVDAVFLGLQRDTVAWKQGILATPPVRDSTFSLS